MTKQHFTVAVEDDHLEKVAAARPVPAISELIWNSLDADATRVDIEIDKSELGMEAINVRDNGHGIPHSEAEALFGKLGGSWKRHGSRSKTKNRMLHGKEGKGRFKPLALGRVVDWTIRYKDKKKLFQYRLSIIRDNLVDVRISDPQQVSSKLGSGIDVRISELDRTYRSLEHQNAIEALTQVFALYLTDYSDVRIFVNSEKLDAENAISSRKEIPLTQITYEQNSFEINLEVIEWLSSSERWIFLCGKEGFPFHRITPKFHSPGYQFSAYIKSPFISELQKKGLLELAEMNTHLANAMEEAGEKIKEYFNEKDIEVAQNEIEEWKTEEVYPYQSDPQNSVEEAERKVFDIVALNVNRHLPDFSESSKKTKSFQLRMLRQAIERGPEELQKILHEVLELPDRQQKELSKLLEEASLTNIISASKLVADRLKFLTGLEALLFDPKFKKNLKERSQLHRMLADGNTWVFGEEFNLTVDDQSLTEVLRKHKKSIGEDIIIDKPVTRIDGKRGVVDLMLSRSVPQNHANAREHLVVELKRPSVTITSKEINQVRDYAFAIAEDERFESLDTKWSFWIVSNKLDKSAKKQARQSDRPAGQVHKEDNIEVWCKTWSEILDHSKARMKFIDEKLQANIDRGSSLKHLQNTYAKYLSGISESE